MTDVAKIRSFGITSLTLGTNTLTGLVRGALSIGGQVVSVKSGDFAWNEDEQFVGGDVKIAIETTSLSVLSLIGTTVTTMSLVAKDADGTGNVTIALASGGKCIIENMTKTFIHAGFGTEGITLSCSYAGAFPLTFTNA